LRDATFGYELDPVTVLAELHHRTDLTQILHLKFAATSLQDILSLAEATAACTGSNLMHSHS